MAWLRSWRWRYLTQRLNKRRVMIDDVLLRVARDEEVQRHQVAALVGVDPRWPDLHVAVQIQRQETRLERIALADAVGDATCRCIQPINHEMNPETLRDAVSELPPDGATLLSFPLTTDCICSTAASIDWSGEQAAKLPWRERAGVVSNAIYEHSRST